MPEDPTPPSAPERARLEHALELLQRQQQVLTNKETLAGVQYKIATLQWRLGLISDAEFEAAEEFYENFCYEADS